MSDNRPTFSLKPDIWWLGPLVANLLYFGGFAAVMALDVFPKDTYMDAATYALLLTFPVYLILYVIFAYKLTKRILLPQVLYFLSLAAFGVFYMADNMDFSRADAYDAMTEGLGGSFVIALISTALCTGISLLTKAVVRNEPPAPAPFMWQDTHTDK